MDFCLCVSPVWAESQVLTLPQNKYSPEILMAWLNKAQTELAQPEQLNAWIAQDRALSKQVAYELLLDQVGAFLLPMDPIIPERDVLLRALGQVLQDESLNQDVHNVQEFLKADWQAFGYTDDLLLALSPFLRDQINSLILAYTEWSRFMGLQFAWEREPEDMFDKGVVWGSALAWPSQSENLRGQAQFRFYEGLFSQDQGQNPEQFSVNAEALKTSQRLSDTLHLNDLENYLLLAEGLAAWRGNHSPLAEKISQQLLKQAQSKNDPYFEAFARMSLLLLRQGISASDLEKELNQLQALYVLVLNPAKKAFLGKYLADALMALKQEKRAQDLYQALLNGKDRQRIAEVFASLREMSLGQANRVSLAISPQLNPSIAQDVALFLQDKELAFQVLLKQSNLLQSFQNENGVDAQPAAEIPDAEILKRLSHPQITEQWLALKLLANQAAQLQNPVLSQALLPFLDSPHPHMRREAFWLLAQVPEPKVLEKLVEFLHDSNPEKQKLAFVAIQKLKKTELLSELWSFLDIFSLREEALLTIADLNNPQAIPPLQKRFQASEDLQWKLKVLSALTRLKAPNALSIWMTYLRDPSVFAQAEFALNLLVASGDFNLDSLLPYLKDPSPLVRQAILSSLETAFLEPGPLQKALTPYLSVLLKDPDAQVRLLSIKLLSQFDVLPPTQLFQHLLKDSEAETRLQALNLVSRESLRVPVKSIEPLLFDPSPEIISRVIPILANHKSPSLQKALPRLLQHSDSETLQNVLSLCLEGKLKATPAQLQPLLKHSEPEVRKTTLLNLARFKAFEPHAAQLLNDSDPQVKAQALLLLMKSKNQALKPLLRPLLQDTSPIPLETVSGLSEWYGAFLQDVEYPEEERPPTLSLLAAALYYQLSTNKPQALRELKALVPETEGLHHLK